MLKLILTPHFCYPVVIAMSPTTLAASNNLKHVSRHPEYYIEGGDLFILVDNTFFRVHSYFLKRDSARFREDLNNAKHRKGTEESSAIRISDATPEEFAKFLWVFYNKSYDQYRASVEEWTAILKIAFNHCFPNVKDFAVRGLESCDIPIASRIKLYQKYEVDPFYVIPLFVKFCVRPEGPTDDETDIMGAKVALIIYRARERLRSQSNSQPISEAEASETICSILGYNAPIPNGPVTSPGQTLFVDKKNGATSKSKAHSGAGKSANNAESKSFVKS